MKKLIIIILLSLPLQAVTKEYYDYKLGFHYINKARRIIKKEGNLDRAMFMLNEASKCNYGFCGNAWMGAFADINMLKADIYNAKGLFGKSLSQLDSINGCGIFIDCTYRDSMKVELLVKIHGLDRVRNDFEAKADSMVLPSFITNLGQFCLRLDSCQFTFCFDMWLPKDDKLDKLTFGQLLRKKNFYPIIRKD